MVTSVKLEPCGWRDPGRTFYPSDRLPGGLSHVWRQFWLSLLGREGCWCAVSGGQEAAPRLVRPGRAPQRMDWPKRAPAGTPGPPMTEPLPGSGWAAPGTEQLTRLPAGGASPTWSPRGARLQQLAAVGAGRASRPKRIRVGTGSLGAWWLSRAWKGVLALVRELGLRAIPEGRVTHSRWTF